MYFAGSDNRFEAHFTYCLKARKIFKTAEESRRFNARFV